MSQSESATSPDLNAATSEARNAIEDYVESLDGMNLVTKVFKVYDALEQSKNLFETHGLRLKEVTEYFVLEMRKRVKSWTLSAKGPGSRKERQEEQAEYQNQRAEKAEEEVKTFKAIFRTTKTRRLATLQYHPDPLRGPVVAPEGKKRKRRRKKKKKKSSSRNNQRSARRRGRIPQSLTLRVGTTP